MILGSIIGVIKGDTSSHKSCREYSSFNALFHHPLWLVKYVLPYTNMFIYIYVIMIFFVFLSSGFDQAIPGSRFFFFLKVWLALGCGSGSGPLVLWSSGPLVFWSSGIVFPYPWISVYTL